MLIDIHTHILAAEGQNHLRFIVGKHSLGIHPWDLVAPYDIALYEEQFKNLKNNMNKDVIGIGECGLDRRHDGVADIETQMKVLEWHLDWASAVQMPIIIHCVRAYSDLLHLLKIKKFNGKILLHDYNGNSDVTEKLLHYECYFSFGHSLFNRDSKASDLFKSLPREKIFLESDNHHQFGFDAIYHRAASLLGMDQEDLEKLLEKNLIEFFSDLDNVSTADVINNLSNT